MKVKVKPKDKPHYVNNKIFSQSVVDYVNLVNEARENDQDDPIISEYIGTCFLKISEGLSRKPNFIGYTYREEMVMDGVENCVKAIMNYNIEKATRTGLPNAFSYFTQIIWYAFLRRIQKEKKYQDIKERYMIYADVEDFVDSNTSNSTSIIDRARHKSQQLRQRDTVITTKVKAKKISKKRMAGPKIGLEYFY